MLLEKSGVISAPHSPCSCWFRSSRVTLSQLLKTKFFHLIRRKFYVLVKKIQIFWRETVLHCRHYFTSAQPTWLQISAQHDIIHLIGRKINVLVTSWPYESLYENSKIMSGNGASRRIGTAVQVRSNNFVAFDRFTDIRRCSVGRRWAQHFVNVARIALPASWGSLL
jgi:hypothetical protein